MKSLTATTLKTLVTITVLVSLVFLTIPRTRAADFNNRYLQLDDSRVNITTIHTFGFDIVSGTDVGSIAFEYCSNSPLDDDPCVAPTGLNVSAANLDTEIGETGFSIHANTNANLIVLSRVLATPTPGPVQYIFSNVINPDTVGSQYVRIYTYLSDDGTGAHIDRGGLAYAINDGVSVQAYVPPVLIFCVGTTITGTNCSTAAGSSVDFGILSPNGPSSGITQMAAGTNGVGGYNISVIGTTMTSGNNIIDALTTPTLSNAGSKQFGLNLVSNTSPSVGQNISGPGTGTPLGQYSQANRFHHPHHHH